MLVRPLPIVTLVKRMQLENEMHDVAQLRERDRHELVHRDYIALATRFAEELRQGVAGPANVVLSVTARIQLLFHDRFPQFFLLIQLACSWQSSNLKQN